LGPAACANMRVENNIRKLKLLRNLMKYTAPL